MTMHNNRKVLFNTIAFLMCSLFFTPYAYAQWQDAVNSHPSAQKKQTKKQEPAPPQADVPQRTSALPEVPEEQATPAQNDSVMQGSLSELQKMISAKEEKKELKSRSWSNPYDKDENKETKEAKVDTQNDEDALSEEQKIWNQYEQLSKNGKSKSKKKQTANKAHAVETEETEVVEVDENTSKNKSHGLQSILEQYKNSQSGKKALNTRSFGSID